MVKPPKTMEPSAIKDMTKAGRDRQKAFSDDSFHVYMARKIDMQRSQFGCRQLPPSPFAITRSVSGNKQSQSDEQKNDRPLPMLQPQSVSEKDINPGQQFAPDYNKNDPQRQKKFGVDFVLKRLQRRHGVVDNDASSFDATTTTSSKKRRRNEVPTKNTDCPMQPLEMPNHGDDDLPTFKDCCDNGSNFVLPVEKTSDKYMCDDDDIRTCTVTEDVLKVPAIHDIDKRFSTDKKRTMTVRPDLFFYGIVVLINGFTNPDAETLQRLLQKHGGDVEKYETTRITHIIAERLSKAKANVYMKQQRNPKPVCQPKWITDSVEAFKLLPYQNYILDDIKMDKNVRSVASMFHQQSTTSSDFDIILTHGDSTNTQTAANFSMDNDTSTPHETYDSNSQMPIKVACRYTDIATNAPESKIILSSSSLPKRDVLLENSVLTAQIRPEFNVPKESAKEERYIDGKVRTVGTDPNFLESFFSSSRLSFIGSFRQRTRQQQQSPSTKRNTSVTESTKMERFIVHVDMDCFFASVILRNYPQYRDKPVAISHNSDSADHSSRQSFKDSTSECATCNYVARTYGIKKGMFLSRAKELCPDLIILPYDYEGYEEVSDTVADILDCYASELNGYVEHVSCDEAYMEIFVPLDEGKSPNTSVAEIAEAIRKEIELTTHCTASVGVATNKFLAKLATDHVKPNRSFVMNDFYEILKPLKLRDLYGVGYKMGRKLEHECLVSVQDIWDLGDRAEPDLCKILGAGLGKKVYGYCHGRDDRGLQVSMRKTIGAECNYGVRFDGPYGVDHMIEGLCREVEKRMTNLCVKGMKVTLKVKQRKSRAPPPPKYLGHGSCHNLSKSVEVRSKEATRTWQIFFEAAMDMYRALKVGKDEVRGMGIVISKLVNDDCDAAQESVATHPIAKWFCKHTSTKNGSKFSRKVDFILPARMSDNVGNVLGGIDAESKNSNIICKDSARYEGDNINTECNDVVLPALSQIHMSQILVRPSPMRKHITSEIGNVKSKATSETCNMQNPMRDARFRQIDVKRMLRLASVKAGVATGLCESGEAMSLTQLQLLPLELQLGIANKDSNDFGQTSPFKQSQKGYNLQLRRTILLDDENAESMAKMSGIERTIQLCHNDSGEEYDIPLDDNGTNYLFPNFCRDNVLPLIAHMKENPEAGIVAIQQITEFLCICVAENRLSDTVVLLQKIKQYGNVQWSNAGFESVFKMVDRHARQHYRAKLDKEWILQM